MTGPWYGAQNHLFWKMLHCKGAVSAICWKILEREMSNFALQIFRRTQNYSVTNFDQLLTSIAIAYLIRCQRDHHLSSEKASFLSIFLHLDFLVECDYVNHRL